MAPRTLTTLVALSFGACAVETASEPANEPGEDPATGDQYLVRENKVALNKVALNKVALNKVALNTIGLNKVALNKVALNKVALNRASLDQTFPASTLARVDINYDSTEYDLTITRRAMDGTTTSERNDEGITLSDVAGSDLVNIFEKSARCLNAEGVTTSIYLNGALATTGVGMFGLAARPLTYRQYIESYMACMAVWANDQSVLINVTADLPATTTDVPTQPSEANFTLPAESIGYKLVLGETVVDAGITYVAIDGTWQWNMSRHQAWSQSFGNLMTWIPALGTYDQTTNRLCLTAAIAHQPMPAACGGDLSRHWPGALTAGLRVPATEPTSGWCGGRLGSTYGTIDYTKGTTCNTPLGPVSAVFYADLAPPLIVEDYVWEIIIREMSANAPSTTGSGSGS